jgi:hypothetical protein
MIKASFARASPSLVTSAREEPPSATSPSEEKGVRRNVWGAA